MIDFDAVIHWNPVLIPATVRTMLHTLAAQQPEHVDFDESLPLPFGLRDVRTDQGVVRGEN